MFKKAILISLFYFLFFSSYGQKVGLVLSGGGAKGLAHIGVIKALEENNIPIDYITGTSMGAIIGGLYAAGYSPEEMETLFKSEDFKFWSTGEIPPKYVYFFKQLDENPSFIDLDFVRKEDKIQLALPTNIVPSGQMDFGFMELFSPANALAKKDFNNLFIPFRCVATDIYRGEQVVFRNGNLGESIRASMTFPFYFKPIEIDSVLLFDGGLVNNFPSDVMLQDFKPGFTIGSAVGFKNIKPPKDDLRLQLENMIVRKSNYTIPDSIGLTIKSPVDHIELFDFEQLELIEKEGYDATMAQIEQIKSRIKSRRELEQLNRQREEFRSKCPTLKFSSIQVSGVDGSQRHYIIHSIQHKLKVIDLEELRGEYFKILADDKIKSLLPTADFNKESGLFELQLKAEQKKPLAVGVGGYFSLSDVNQGYIGLDYRLFNNQPITIQSNLHIGKFYSSIMAGTRFNFTTKHPVSLELYFIKNRTDFFAGATQLIFENNLSHYIIRNDDKIQLNLSFPDKTTSKWDVGLDFINQSDAYYQTINYTKSDSPDETTFTAGDAHIRFETKAFNKKQYPTEGKMLNIELGYLFGSEKEEPGSLIPLNDSYKKAHNYLELNLNYEKYIKSFKWLNIGISTDAYLSNKPLFHNYTSTLLAAQAYSPTVNSSMRYIPYLRSNNFIAGGLKAILPITSNTHFRLEGYYFQPFKEITSGLNQMPIYKDKLFTSSAFIGSGGLVYHTPFGPASLLLNYYSNSDPRFYLQVSFGYLLYNHIRK